MLGEATINWGPDINRTMSMNTDRWIKALLCVLVLVVLLFLFILLDLSWAGNRTLSLGEVWAALTGNGTWGTDQIVNSQNLPRIAIGVFVGAGLAVTGGVMQAVFRNPLADPYILGLSSGASLGSALAILVGVSFIPLSASQPMLAFVFCLLTMFLVYTVSRAGGGNVRTETLVLQDIVFWSMGNLGNPEWTEIAIVATVVVAGAAVMLTQCRKLNAMMLGDAHAMDLGVDVAKVRLMLLVVSSLVVAVSVAFVGTIGFIGLVIPHIFRLMLGPDNRLVLPLSTLGGAAFIIMCDYVAHFVAPYYGVLPIGVVTSLVGAPFFVYLLVSRRREVGW